MLETPKIYERTSVADLLKGLAVFFMILVHLVELFATETVYTGGFGKMILFLGAAPVAPVYMIIMGYFIAQTTKTTKALVLRGVKLFGLGMILNIALNFNLILTVLSGDLQIDLLPYIFGVDILQFAGIATITIALIKQIFEKRNYLLLITILLIPIIGAYLNEVKLENEYLNYCSAFFIGNVHWSYFPLFPWISYPLAGLAFSNFTQRYRFAFFNKPSIKYVAIISLTVFVYFTRHYSITICSQLSLYYHQGIDFFMWTILFIALYSICVQEFDRILGNTYLINYFKWLGSNVTYIYVIQWLIIGNLATEIFRSVSSIFSLILYFVAILLISSLVTYLIKKWINKQVAKQLPKAF